MSSAQLRLAIWLLVILLSGCGGGSDSGTAQSPGAAAPAPSNPSPPGNPGSPPNTNPVANAGSNQSVLVGAQVTLNGAASSDADGDSLSFAWVLVSKPPGSAATLAGVATPLPNFTADVAGVYIATLIVSDGSASSSPSTVTTTASASNAAPAANAGPNQSVLVGFSYIVQLNGSASTDADGDPLTFTWTLPTKPAGSNASLVAATSSSPTFMPDLAGTYVASLVVNDGKVNSAPSTVTILASALNAPPIANAGPNQSVMPGALVALNGSGSSDANADPLTYSWSLTVKPSGSTATLSNPSSVAPTFTADVAGTFIASLIVSDGKASSGTSTVTIAATEIADSRYVLHANGTATDVITSLTWMRCQIGQTWTGSACIGQPTTYAWIYAVALSGTVTFAGESDWRVPTIRELESLVGRTKYLNDAFNRKVFDQVFVLWSSTEWFNQSDGAVWVPSQMGEISYVSKSSQYPVLMVRGLASVDMKLDRPDSDYFAAGGVVTHSPAGLMWKRCSEGQSWDGSTCVGLEAVYTWDQAMALRQSFAGYDDWRLPTVEEQLTLVSYDRNQRPINSVIFPATPRTWSWTSTERSDMTVWSVEFGFSYGETKDILKSQTYPVRMVRKTQ